MHAGPFCSVSQVVILGLCASGVAVFINESLMYSVAHLHNNLLLCAPIKRFIPTIRTLDHIDVFLNRLLPYSLVIVLELACVLRAIRTAVCPPDVTTPIPGTERSTTGVRVEGTEREVVWDVCRVVLVQVGMVLLLTAPSAALRVFNTVQQLRFPQEQNIRLMLVRQGLEFVANARCAISLLYIVPLSQTLRTQVREWLSQLIATCKMKARSSDAAVRAGTSDGRDASAPEPVEV